ncbi:MAG: glycosyltransferase [Candidatus Omnitrophica bacterium]|nr:glycosyltransferase [Candidatus Omnitrophota bacterium]
MSVTDVTVSVIVPAYNAAATIGRTLEALSGQKCSQPFEVIVVDDGSRDNTADIVRSFSSVKYARQDNAGPAAARNHGARLARGAYLAFTDSDCVPHEDWISLLMEGLKRAQTGVVAGSYGIANPQSLLARCVYKEILWRHTHLMPDFPNSFGSYNFCARKDVFEAVGGFNTAYRHASGEDNDLSYKIIRSGQRIYFQRMALVDHYHPQILSKYLKEQFRHGFWRLKMYKDHPAMMRGDGYTYWKDMIEIPWAAFLAAGAVLSAGFNFIYMGMVCWAALSFLFFEIFCAWMMTRLFFEGILYGGVMFLRALARLAGFSTGILIFLPGKKEKIS